MANKKETKHERFIRVAEMRTQKVLDDLHSLSRCAAPDVYEYTDEELQRIYSAIEQELQDVKDKFAGHHRFSLSSDYSPSN